MKIQREDSVQERAEQTALGLRSTTRSASETVRTALARIARLETALQEALAVLPSAKIASNPFNVSEITAHNEKIDAVIAICHAAIEANL
jgi:hypothetical protein